MTRSVVGSTARGRVGQGRPLGLVLAWLACGDQDEYDSVELHNPRAAAFPSFEDRMLARAELSTMPGSADWLALERHPTAEEDAEPEVVP